MAGALSAADLQSESKDCTMLCLNRTKAGTRTRIKALGAAEPECFSLCAHKISTQTHLAMQDNKNIPL